jgi:hypothetical protein
MRCGAVVYDYAAAERLAVAAVASRCGLTKLLDYKKAAFVIREHKADHFALLRNIV